MIGAEWRPRRRDPLPELPALRPPLQEDAPHDLTPGLTVHVLYRYLHLRKSSPLSRLQREMLATVVNGKIGGAA